MSRSRREVREALLSELTPDKMRKAVRKMLAIISSSDKKAAVAAFKVLTDAAGIRWEQEHLRAGAQFTFVLPAPGVIPERSEVREAALCKALPVSDGPPVAAVTVLSDVAAPDE